MTRRETGRAKTTITVTCRAGVQGHADGGRLFTPEIPSVPGSATQGAGGWGVGRDADLIAWIVKSVVMNKPLL